MAGITLRILLLAAWIGLTGTHIVRHLLPGLGLVPQADAASTISARLNRSFRYQLRWRSSPAAAWEPIGTCVVAARNDDVGAVTSTEIEVRDTRAVPAMQLLRKAIRGLSGAGAAQMGIKFRVEQSLDASLRLRKIEASGHVFGVPFTAEGPVDHRGLDLSWNFAGSSGKKLLAEVRPDAIAGDEFGMGMPPGLKPGATFRQRISSMDMVRMGMQTKTAVFKVLSASTETTPAGSIEVVEVEMSIDDRRVASLWCDQAGVVYRQELADQGLRIVLIEIDNELGRRLWPHPEADPASATSATSAGSASVPAQP